MTRSFPLAYVICALALAFGALEVCCIGLTKDTDMFMHCALYLWQYGAGQLYDRCIDQNAPFHVAFYAPLAALAVKAQLPASVILHGACYALCIMSLLVLRHVLIFHQVERTDRRAWLAVTAFTLLVVPCPLGVFADRDHLLFILALPWIAQMLLNKRPLAYSCVLAALGFCMKPYDVVLFGLLTLACGPPEYSLRLRLFSVSSLMIAGIMLTYVASIFIFFPAYLSGMVPVAAIYYSTVQLPIPRKLLNGSVFILFSLGLLREFAGLRRGNSGWWALLGATLLLYAFGSGWTYTLYLLAAPLSLICVMPWCEGYRAGMLAPALCRGLSAGVLLILAGLAGWYMDYDIRWTRQTGNSSFFHYLPGTLREELRHAGSPRFILLSVNIWNNDIEPLGHAPQSALGFNGIGALLWLYAHPGDPRFGTVLHFVTDRLVKALKDEPHAAVIVETSSTKLKPGHDADILGFLEQDPRVREAMRPYRQSQVIDQCAGAFSEQCRFAVWRQ